LRTRLTYPSLEAEAAAAHLMLLQGVIDERIIPNPAQFGEWVFDPEKLGENEDEEAITSFSYEVYNLADDGLITVDDDDDALTVTDEGRAWDDEMTLYLEAMIAIDEGRIYLVQRHDGHNGYMHAWDPREEDEHDARGGVSLLALREARLIDWGGDMVPFITTAGGEFLDAYRPELFDRVDVEA
jgi:hypothetical protein